MIKVKATDRPTCEQLMHMPGFADNLPESMEEELNLQMLNTIKFPSNIRLLKDKLPKSQYESNL